MGTTVSKKNIFRFGEEKYNQLLQQSIEKQADNNNSILKTQHTCTIKGHEGTCIDSICTNIVCNASSRMVCSMCMRDELHKKDKNFVISQFRFDSEISKIVNSFKILIQKELDSLEFEILIKKLVTLDQQKMLTSIKNLEEINTRLDKYKKFINYLDQMDYYGQLFVNKKFSLFEYLKNMAIRLEKLQEQFYHKTQNHKQIQAQSKIQNKLDKLK